MVPVSNRKNIKLYTPLKRLEHGVVTISYPPIKPSLLFLTVPQSDRVFLLPGF